MNKFETKVKESLKQAAEQTPDYWENISKTTKIPYNGRMIMKNTPKRNIFKLRYIAPAVCGLALVVMLSIMNLGNKPALLDNQTIENLQINSILSQNSSKIRLPENGTTQTVSYEAYLEQAGLDLELWLPTGLEKAEDAYVYYNEDGSEFMMSGYSFHNANTGEYLTIRFQKDALPITDTRYSLENEAASTINGQEIVIGYSKDLDAYFTTFMYNGTGYELTAMQGISQDDFIQIIQSIIK